MSLLPHYIVVLLLSLIIYVQALNINSFYVIVDPVSTSTTLAIQIKDHYTSSKQRIGNMNKYLMDIYIKQKGFKSWMKMAENDNYYILYSNDTLNAPLSLRVTFIEEPYTNYTWNSFLSNLAGTTIYHLYIEQKIPSTTEVVLDSLTISTAAIRSTSSTYSTAFTTAGADSNDDEESVYFLPPQATFTLNQLLTSLVLVSVICVLLFICSVSVCCCCYFYFHKRIQSANKPNNQTRGSVILSMSKRPQFAKMNVMQQGIEGIDESIAVQCEMDCNDEDESNLPILRNIGNKLRKVATISLKTLSRSHSYDEHNEIETSPIIISTESKSRTSVSLHCAQPGVDHNSSHTYSLSMEQLLQLQHGISVETENGIRIKLKHENNRNRVLSLIKTYDTQGYSPVNRVDHGVSNEDIGDEESSSSNESLYNYQHNENEETDGGITTPSNASSIKYDVDQLASLPPEEGLISNTE